MKPEIYVLKAEDLKPEQFDLFFKYSQEEHRQKIKNCMIEKKRNIEAMSQIFAKICVKKTFNIAIREQKISYGEFKKPYLFGHSDIHFNISHSEGLLVCAVYDKPIGVDVERVRSYPENLIKKVCSESELEFILKSGNINYEFCRLWTGKEACLKLQGRGFNNVRLKEISCENAVSYNFGEYIISAAIQ